MDEQIDIIVFEDEDGNEIEFELQFSFEHKDKEYAVLTELMEGEEMEEDMPDLYIFEIVGEGDEEEFVPVSEDVLDELGKVVETIFEEVVDHEHDENCDHDHD